MIMTNDIPDIYEGMDKSAMANVKIMCGSCIHKDVCVHYGYLGHNTVLPIMENCPHYLIVTTASCAGYERPITV